MSKLYTSQINYAGARILHGTNVRWLGTFARDEIPDLQHEQRPCALVFNTDMSSGPGEHWLALFAEKDKKVEMFDSYGLPPTLYSFSDNDFRSSSRTIQALGTSVCGHYCLLFLYLRAHANSFDYTTYLLEKRFTDSSAARSLIDLVRSPISHIHCTGQSCSMKC